MRVLTHDEARRVYDRIGKGQDSQAFYEDVATREIVRVADFPSARAVFEFGCGTGSTALVHAPYVKHIHAIDVSSQMIEIAKAKADAAHVGNVTFEQSAIEGFSAAERTFDAVLGLSILHLLADRDAAIAKVHRMLAPGGVFVTSTACLGDTLKYRLLISLIGPVGRFLGLLPLVRVFTKKALEDALTGAGFAIDYDWAPGKGKSVFIVAKKAERCVSAD